MASQALLFPDGDCVADGLFFGEGEGEVESLVRVLAERRAQPKRERLEAAASVRGFWPAGALGRPVTQAVCARPHPPLGAYPVLPGPEASTARLTLTYGCPFRCSFCFEGYERRPHRFLPVEELLEAARRLKLSTGGDTLELASFNVNTHPRLPRAASGAQPSVPAGELHEPAGRHPERHPRPAGAGDGRGQAQLHPRHRRDQSAAARVSIEEAGGRGGARAAGAPRRCPGPGGQAVLPADAATRPRPTSRSSAHSSGGCARRGSPAARA